MADIFDKDKRSQIMSMVGSKNTKPEMMVRKYLHSKGIRYSLHNKKLIGKPDLKLSKYHTVIFINGCFWHNHKCSHYSMPKTNKLFWKTKVENNCIRDKKVKQSLKKLGWNILEIWQCQLKSRYRDRTLTKLLDKLKSLSIPS